MTQYNTLNINLSISQLSKLRLGIRNLRLGIRNGTEVTLNLSLHIVGNSSDETNFPHKL